MLTNRLHDPSQNRKHPTRAGPEAKCAVRTACSRKAELEQTFKNRKCFNSFGWSEEAMSWRTCSKGHRLGSRQRKLNISALPKPPKGNRLDSRQRESSRNELLTVESKLLRCPQVEESARACALFSVFRQRTRKSRTGWRRGGDSNPRDPFEPTRVPGVRLKPGSATSPRDRDYASGQRMGPVRDFSAL